MAPLRTQAQQTGRFDYDHEVEALHVLDRYTYRVRFAEPYPNFIYDLTNCNLSCAVAREVVEAYGDRIMQHPVGTNAYRLAEWRRSSRIVLERNPGYREHLYDPQPPANDRVKQAIAERLRGRKLPMIDRVEVYVIEESQPRFLAFLNAEHDLITGVPADFVNTTIPNGRLAPNLAARGIGIDRSTELDLAFTYFGMEHPVLGGYTPERVALRRAIALGYTAARRAARTARRHPTPSVPIRDSSARWPSTTRPRPGRCSTPTATSTATATATASCPTARRWCWRSARRPTAPRR